MPVHLPCSTVILPLTRETLAAREGHRLHGRIEDCTLGLERSLGRFLVTERIGEVFSHPTLFDDAAFADRTAGWVRVSLSDGRLVMQPCAHDTHEVRGPDVRTATPAAMAHVSVDAVIALVSALARFGGSCANPLCEGAEPLDLRRAVLVQGTGALALCADCYAQECVRIPDLAGRTIIDGRRLSFGAPVAVFADPQPSVK